MTKSKNKTANTARAANAKDSVVGKTKQKTPPAPPPASEATEVTPTQVAPTLSERKQKKLADSGGSASGGNVTTEPQKPPAKKAKARKGAAGKKGIIGKFNARGSTPCTRIRCAITTSGHVYGT
ncbi:hypothetical protein SARC_04045 [Sphaeroforma arctica JP610]|uniref:Uncharacterized protein n=1 Tax=Sphaeroforma arctica JP610 TaxID=667725 RepID=A0A0L0G3U3_9EUKA|nr:hypothetical protein SARC_04045 [Sphaeroforma arctica JP610]KNC83715.1 hypothetical protein SARC_04045 [Sphaeroforma arctica JP610]|eukprot:XP_014157617.1 hypothetical protein SARC_04045 [Sphaeroforma arctica JP610]